MAGVRSLLVATAGHVDHGKSTVVRHLTGRDPDRLAEEQRRGLTIDLGFAVAALPSGAEVSIVDVPGHARYLSTMVAGVGAVRAALLVVSAVEGWRAQSEEHLRVVDLLGVPDGVVVLTRSEAAGRQRGAEVEAEVRRRVEGTVLAGAEVVAVDLPAGHGHDTLLAALERLVARAAPAVDRGRPRLWVDRCFTVAGAGTVVTGSLADGPLVVGATVEMGGEAFSHPGRIRGLEVHGRAVERADPGHRVAVNLAGVGRGDIGRGAVVVEPGRWLRTRTVDVALSLLPRSGPVRSGRGAHLLAVGTSEQAVHLRVLGGGTIQPGTTAGARLRFERALPLLPGDRFVLRDTGRAATAGGGVVLDVDPVLPAARAAPDLDPLRVVAERGWVAVTDLERRTGAPVPATVEGWVASPEAWASARARLASAVAGAGPLGLALDSLDERDRLVLAALEGMSVEGGRARPAGAEALDSPYLRALRADPFRPPSPAEHGCPPEELRALRSAGLAVHHDGTWFAADAADRAAAVVAGLLADHPEGVTVAQARDALGTTRRWVLPLLALLDGRGVTRRRGAVRVGGPRLPGPGPGPGGEGGG
ncbi:MAG TPA: SelB C-terminal domain-containing protein [Acidimicrobiales bacterium]|nr:SelB C-terminal domain-containing protein [Acidimicrobiales bacterium]